MNCLFANGSVKTALGHTAVNFGGFKECGIQKPNFNTVRSSPQKTGLNQSALNTKSSLNTVLVDGDKNALLSERPRSKFEVFEGKPNKSCGNCYIVDQMRQVSKLVE